MWQLDYPWLLLLLPLPWIGYRYLPDYREARNAVRVPFFAAMSLAVGQTPNQPGSGHNLRQLLLNVLVWSLLLIAVSRPVWIEQPIERQQPVRDLMLAIDISQSMETADFTGSDGQQINRLTAVKQVVHGFIDQRKDDRLGLIVFGTGAYPQAPLTLDHSSLSILLDETGIGMAGPNTAIGDAIGLSLKLLDQAKEPQKVVILLTDGNDTSSAITPDHAASIAAAKGVVIHTIGIGDPNGTGEDKVNLQALQRIAAATGGQFFRAENLHGLDEVYATLDQITPHQVKVFSHQPKRDLFWWPLGAAIMLLFVYHLIALLSTRLVAPSTAREG
ncbi:MAG: von Willebrand factor type domain protein [Pseudomonas sp.]|uniref:vWA domain-containing protein n=1 Tax=Pseudomonas sp. TaxID=306 RepID=UPI002623C71A|nr:VWA domain-containing protein [Pseudomonas sp.]MDB6051160.1 von Willebrand factor type domain protein [Pseudomonas sp.]